MTTTVTTKRDWKYVAIVTVIAVAFATILSLGAIQTIRVSGNKPVAAAPVKVKPTAPAVATVNHDGLEGEVTEKNGKTYFKVTKFNPGKRSGTLTFIAGQFDTTVGQLVSWNDIQNPNLIHVGQKLRVK